MSRPGSHAPYAGRSPLAKKDDVDKHGPVRGAKAAKITAESDAPVVAAKMPVDTSPTPPPRELRAPVPRTSAEGLMTELSPPAPKTEGGEIQARLQSLELEMANLNANLRDNIQATVGQAVLSALALERERIPEWVNNLQASVVLIETNLQNMQEGHEQTGEKIRACEGQIATMQEQVNQCVANTHPIFLAERAAMLTTANQTRITGFKERDGEKYLKNYMSKKFPDSSNRVSVTKSGSAIVATFASADEAKKVAKGLKNDCKELLVRPQLPSVVLESQGPLKRAYAALLDHAKAAAAEGVPGLPDLTKYKIDFKGRAITDGESVLARQYADGCIQPNLHLLGPAVSNAVMLASKDRDYFYNLKQHDASKAQKVQSGKPGKEFGKGKGKGKKGKSSDMDVDKND